MYFQMMSPLRWAVNPEETSYKVSSTSKIIVLIFEDDFDDDDDALVRRKILLVAVFAAVRVVEEGIMVLGGKRIK